MKTPRKSQRWWLMLAVFALVASACSGSTLDTTTTTTADVTTTTADTGATTTTAEPGAAGAMTVTVDLDPDAVWSDGTPITAADFVCTYEAFLNTPGSITTTGYAEMQSVAAGESDKQVVIEFTQPYAPYKNVFNQILPAHILDNCSDISGDLLNEMPVSGRPWLLQEWSD